MELDEIKNKWAEYDKKLSYNIRLNETLLRKRNLKGSKGEMLKLLVYEIFNTVTSIIIVIALLWYSVYYMSLMQYCIPGFIGAIITSIYIAFSVIRLNILLSIDYYGSPVMEVQKSILKLKKYSLNIRKYEILLMPLLMFSILPIYAKFRHNFNVYDSIEIFLPITIVALIIAYFISMLIYKHLYDKKFIKVEAYLKELEEFENEKDEI